VYRNNRGFTLIEFLVAIVIIMVGLLGLLQAVNTGLLYNLNTQLRAEAVAVADRYLAREMAKSFDLVSTSVMNRTDSRPILSGFKNFSVVRQGSILSTGNSKQVGIVVSWRHKNKRFTQEASSVISKNQ
jgi:type IV pilus assembly protein PilV